MIALVDFGAGNLTSVRKAFAAEGACLVTLSQPAEIANAGAVVIPGVGHFAATRALGDLWRAAIADAAGRATPILGICLGMQWLFEGSEEDPDTPGAGIFAGRCTRLNGGPDLKIPHVGWNALHTTSASALLEDVGDGAYMYFTHAYAAPVTPACVAETVHGAPFAAVVEAGAVFGVQFHPEKSGAAGRALLRNFLRLARAR